MILLDINMPILNGMETLIHIRERIRNYNENLKPGNPKLIRPLLCYLTQFNSKTMMQFMTVEDEADCYLEKPLPPKELVSLLRLLNLY